MPGDLPLLSYRCHILLMGSCFAQSMGERLLAAKLPCEVNPYGILYNPLSIVTALQEIMAGKTYTQEDLVYDRNLWHSPMHHGDFSSPDAGETLRRVNGNIRRVHDGLPGIDRLLVTFGTAWVYERNVEGVWRVAGNCHRMPESGFRRRLLQVDEIVESFSTLLAPWLEGNLALKVLFTVSPIRHVRDGLHANQLSKSTLLLAVEGIRRAFPASVFYFPAYELLVDELRDYRFYADDLVHPSPLAQSMVWERFTAACCTRETLCVMQACEEIAKALQHRPFRPDSREYKAFLEQIVLKIDQLNRKYPYLDFQNEKDVCHTRLKT
ncbi:MAG: GSCFA domain-containing protein [Prevotellaceae bacterium]|nr:GSCFA domain-containing protein [Prevotellaceae bacterium]